MPASSSPSPNPETSRGLAGWLLTTILLGANLYFHDMWFDELQAWGLVCSSRNVIDLIGMIEPEGHPPLWYLLIYPLTRLSEDPRWMQLLVFSLGATSFGLIWFKAPFRPMDKLLLCLSFQVGYLFSVFSRCYSVGTLLVLLFLSDLPDNRATAWRGWLVLALLVNVHFYFFLTACSLAVVWLRCSVNRRELVRGSGFFFLGNVLNAFCLTRIFYTTAHESSGFMLTLLWPAFLHFIVLLSADFFSPRLKFERAFRPLATIAFATSGAVALAYSDGMSTLRDIAVIAAGFLPLCNPFGGSYWNFQPPPGAGLLIALFVITCVYRCLLDFSSARWLITVQMGCLLAVSATSHPLNLWHSGVLFLSFVGFLWIGLRVSRVAPPGWLFTALLVFQAVTGVQAMIMSKFVPVSAIKQTAEWLNENAGEDHLLIGLELFPVSAVSNYVSGRDLYFPHRDRTLKYCPWGDWFLSLQPPRIVRELEKSDLDKAYLVASLAKQHLMRERFAPYADQLRLSEVAVFDNASAEKFVVFEITLLR